jgi:hypothetical protein
MLFMLLVDCEGSIIDNSSAPSLLPSLLQLLTSALRVPEDACAAAALALKHVCDGQFNYQIVFLFS